MTRPCKYKPAYAKDLIEYFGEAMKRETLKDDEGELVLDKNGRPIFGAIEFPTIAGFAVKIGVNRDTLYAWADMVYPESNKKLAGKPRFPEWVEALSMAKDYQEAILIPGAMNGRLDSRFAQFFAVNNLGYSNKQEIEQTNTNLDYKIPAGSDPKAAADAYKKLIK